MYIIYDLLLLSALLIGIVSASISFFNLAVSEWKTFIISMLFLLISITTWLVISSTDEQRALNNNVIIKGYGVVTSISEYSIHVDGRKVTLSEKVNKVHNTNFDGLYLGDVVEMEFIDGAMQDYIIKITKIK